MSGHARIRLLTTALNSSLQSFAASNSVTDVKF